MDKIPSSNTKNENIDNILQTVFLPTKKRTSVIVSVLHSSTNIRGGCCALQSPAPAQSMNRKEGVLWIVHTSPVNRKEVNREEVGVLDCSHQPSPVNRKEVGVLDCSHQPSEQEGSEQEGRGVMDCSHQPSQ